MRIWRVTVLDTVFSDVDIDQRGLMDVLHDAAGTDLILEDFEMP